MDERTTQYQPPLPRHANPVVVLELRDLELVEASPHGGGDDHGFPPAISDHELSQLVEECTYELCQLGYGYGSYRYGSYGYGAYTG